MLGVILEHHAMLCACTSQCDILCPSISSYMYICIPFTQNGGTPLFMASQKGNLDVVEILLAAGAKVDLAKDVSLDSLEHTCNL